LVFLLAVWEVKILPVIACGVMVTGAIFAAKATLAAGLGLAL